MATYKLYKKTSDTAKEEIKIPASSVSGLANVATSGSYDDLTDKPEVPGVPDIVQTTGTSTTAVMSQKAVTDELGKYVDKSTAQTISGAKTFTNNFVCSKNYPIIDLRHSLLTHGAYPSKTRSNEIRVLDKDDYYEGGIRFDTYTDGTQELKIMSRSFGTGYISGVILRAKNKASSANEGGAWILYPVIDGSMDLGTSSKRWRNAYVKNIVADNIPFDSNGLSTGTLGSTKLPSAGRYYIEKKASMSQNIISFVLDFNNVATSSGYAYLSAAGDNALGELWLFVYVSTNGTVTMSEYSPKTNGEISFDKDETGTFKYKKID